MKKMFFKCRNSWRISTLISEYPGLKVNQVLKLFTLYFTEDVDIIVFWEVKGHDISGFHHIGKINLGLQSPLQLQAHLGGKIREATIRGEKTLLAGGRALFASTAREKKELVNSLMKKTGNDCSPIRIIMTYPQMCNHNFAEG
jgi:hypothetical protein